MRIVAQRVSQASVSVEGRLVSQIGPGLLVLVGVEEGDTQGDARLAAGKVAGLRVFEDEEGRMNRSLKEIGGQVLAVSQFTLLGDVRHGKRPSFIKAEEPLRANELYELCVSFIREEGIECLTGVFRAEMRVSLVNEGPVTILYDTRKLF
ncbi:MAG: D-tyrosyl-tRNA(Tyr) deacylase [Christensenellaceae bacterium]|jgi:D-tyrosyl-tRNA(Tyr) deacylase|nr:D-tyrosyl-tRNA(Tyr) deacylase [Christensenellaceae bacterium]